eukprot:TRINITY_DN21337_c0_g1_i1.p1 TRINITY_DN21337_c0_g1~~TRINITY_DN21337_c0_g1_i1.p1  ORF type:complete len:425 (+),score=127.54 TRINITY_DN21337_c0_g1_i1:70-1275(+)
MAPDEDPLDRAAVLAALGPGAVADAGSGIPVVLPVVHVAGPEQAAREAAAAVAAGCCGVQLIGQRRECYSPGDTQDLRRLNAQLLLKVEGARRAGVPAAGLAEALRILHTGPARPEGPRGFWRSEREMAAALIASGVPEPRAGEIARLQRRRGDILSHYSLPTDDLAAAVRAVRSRLGDSPMLCVNLWGRGVLEAAEGLLRPLWRQGVRVDALLCDAHQAALGTPAAEPLGELGRCAAALRREFRTRWPQRRFLYLAGCASKGVGGIEAPESAEAFGPVFARPLSCDAVITSGAGTGRSASRAKLSALRKAAGPNVCVGVASGVTPANVVDCVRAETDIVFVASGIAKDWNSLDPAKLSALLRAAREAVAPAVAVGGGGGGGGGGGARERAPKRARRRAQL